MNKQIIQEVFKLMKLTGKKKPVLKGYAIEPFNVDNCEGLFAKKDDTFFIAFHHTDSLKDAMHDIMARKTYFHRLKVHRGFEKYYCKVEWLIENHIEAENGSIKNIVVCGHSMGAAIATLCAYDLYLVFDDIKISCITTGSARVGGWKFARAFNKIFKETSLRLRNGNDIVSQLPPWFLFYKHVGKLKRIGNWQFWRFWGSTKDHDLGEYIKNYE